ncbi:hypothetical protein ACOME3_005132 [Neoechinorhynchus agilis]
MKLIDPEYFGYLDEDDDFLVEEERQCEIAALKKKVEEFEKRSANDQPYLAMDSAAKCFKAKDADSIQESFLNIPSQDEVERLLVSMRKQQLMEKYVSEELTEKEFEPKDLLGRRKQQVKY